MPHREGGTQSREKWACVLQVTARHHHHPFTASSLWPLFEVPGRRRWGGAMEVAVSDYFLGKLACVTSFLLNNRGVEGRSHKICFLFVCLAVFYCKKDALALAPPLPRCLRCWIRSDVALALDVWRWPWMAPGVCSCGADANALTDVGLARRRHRSSLSFP
jgi:hypothetical protein